MLKNIPFYASLLGKDIAGKKATHSHVLIYGAVEAHALGPSGCIASNQLLADETGLEVGTVKARLSEMVAGRWLHVEYADALKNERKTIVPLLEIRTPLLPSNTPLLDSNTPRYSPVTIDNSNKSTNSFSAKNDFSEDDYEMEAVDDNGDPIKPRAKKGKDPLIEYFRSECKKQVGVNPVIPLTVARTMLKTARQHLTDKQIEAMFKDWFALGKPDNETLQITRALSTARINTFKADNGIK